MSVEKKIWKFTWTVATELSHACYGFAVRFLFMIQKFKMNSQKRKKKTPTGLLPRASCMTVSLVSCRASMATVSRVHKALPANVLCNAIAPELCSKSVSLCCLHGQLAASTAVITQHICKAQKLSDMPAPSNTWKQSTWTELIYLQQTDPPTHGDCFGGKKLRICHALKTNGRHLFSCFSYEISARTVFQKETGKRIHSNSTPNICMAHYDIHFCASYWILKKSFDAFLHRLKYFHWVFMDALYNEERFGGAHIHRLCDQSIRSPAVPEHPSPLSVWLKSTNWLWFQEVKCWCGRLSMSL